MSGLMTSGGAGMYNSLEVVKLNNRELAIIYINTLKEDKLAMAVKFLEFLASKEVVDDVILKAFEESLEEEELSPEEAARMLESEEHVRKGLGIKAADVWKENGL